MVDPNAFRVGQTQVGPMSQASARNFTDANFSAYENPYTSAVTDTTMADIDANDGRIRAQQAAQQAANGGVRNSNNAVLSSLTEGELSRARASSLAGIRSQGFNTAAGLITGDNDRQAQTSQFNAAQTNQGVLAQASADSSRNQLLAQLQSAGLLSNQSAYNQASQFGAGAANDAGQFGANARNQANQFGANAFNNASLDSAGRRDNASQFGANAFNQNSQYNAGATNQNNQFNAGQQDNALMRQLQAAGLLGNLGTAMGADNRANIALQGDLGGQQRDIQQRQMTEEYQRLALIQSLMGVNPNAFIGQTSNSSGTSSGNQTTTQNPSLLTSIGQGASTAASIAQLFAMSDERLKADIKPVGTDAKGRKWYDYRYLWDAPGTVRRGVMAQEVRETDPGAVATHESGFLMVDYAKLEMAA